MLRLAICLASFLLSYSYAQAQDIAFPLLSSTDHSLASIFTNPAGLSIHQQQAFLAIHSNPFQIKALQSNAIGYAIPIKKNVFAFCFEQFGTADYLLQYSKLSYSKSFGKFSGGWRLIHRHEFINDGLASTNTWQAEMGLIIQLSQKASMGFQILNPGVRKEIDDRQKTKIGLRYHSNQHCSFVAELEKENQVEAIGKLGIEYKYYKKLELLFNIESGLQAYRFGNAFLFKQFHCQINTSYHMQLGIGFQYMLSYRLP